MGTAMHHEDGKSSTARPSSWGQQQRLEFIEFRLFWEGRLNRSDLIEYFGISRPQASLDVARYIGLAPDNIIYDKTQKAYLPSRGFRPAIASPQPAAYLDLLVSPSRPQANFVGWMPPLGLLKYPHRQVKTSVLRQVLLAIREHSMIRVDYQSMTRQGPTEREISPHAIAYDGFRWHTRAYCHERKSFRDFVFGRILKVHSASPSSADHRQDEGWTTTLDLVLAPHHGLSAGQKNAVSLDYGMKKNRLVVRTRRALAFYVLRQLGLDKTTGGPRSQQVVLLNRDEIEPLISETS
jgi:hypothetical protein